MTKVYFVRHGKTEYNLHNIFQGGLSDSPLLPIGIQAAKEAGQYLKNVSFEAAYVSPQKRASDTAKLVIAENNQPLLNLEESPEFREMEFGDWDGKVFTHFTEEYQYKMLKENPEKYDPSAFNGESYHELAKRSSEKLADIVGKTTDGNILVVAHAIVISTLIAYLVEGNVGNVRNNGLVDNASVTILEFNRDEKPILVDWNNTSFQK